MNYLLDIAHPAHVHLYKKCYLHLVKYGHKVIVTVKDIPAAIQLLEAYKIPYLHLGSKKDNLIGKALGQLKYDYRLYKIVKNEKIDIGFGSSITIAHVSKFSKMQAIIFDDDDDEVEPLFAKYAHPFCDVVLTPSCTHRESEKGLKYNGYHELAYLHPKHFTPNPEILKEVGLKPGEPFFIVRFNSFKAHHDVGVQGLSVEQKRELINYLALNGKVFITTERNMDDEFLPHQLTVAPEKIHHLMAFATMLVGDSQTMTSEAAVLGVPAIRCNSFVGRIATLEEEEYKYQLTFGFRPERFEEMMKKIKELLDMPDLKEVFQIRRERLLNEKIDVAGFMAWFVEMFPQSMNEMREKPDVQVRFLK